ncbi:ferrous iron transport protein B [Blastopirellula marina]|uniref:Ferrous iron transport protein B n=1 Tax=Blastopirellula marina TaxID=124 RepID=A0A2S8G1S7_9BACT|nr:ferrous iron transport protein B [Blastopirellula marina]PQO38399.1 ferrous iron transport protein B [Blastopirellula marina]PTL45056.1 ferrous iron transport protein B [Blastopirellula marina]
MSVDAPARTLNVALVGNPNTGKSTLFHALSGVRQKTGNYPGVTVEKKHGTFTHQSQKVTLIDLPGTYSLAPRSPDEMVTVDVLLGRQANEAKPNAVLVIVDASNLERNLYIVSQVKELGLPMIVALNMVDIAEEKGITVDAAKLQERLGIPVVPTQANRRGGMDRLRETIVSLHGQESITPLSPFPEEFCDKVTQLHTKLQSQTPDAPRYLAERLLLDTSGYLEKELVNGGLDLHNWIVETRNQLAEIGQPVPAIEAISRYKWVQESLDGIVTRETTRKVTWSDRIDRILTDKVAGTIFFILVMSSMFMAVFSDYSAGILMGWIEGGFELLANGINAILPDGALKSLLIDGVIAGVGGVLVFLPQICILFFFIAILEDCGYLARAAYLMDKLFSKVGLSGKSFIPLLSSFACAIPGIMAARVIENRRDRLITILVAPLMSCSARMPVYVLLTGAFIPDEALLGFIPLQVLVMLSMYLLGILAAVGVAFILRKTILPGETPPFVMELPTYKFPSFAGVFWVVVEKGWAFVKRAGTLIFAMTVIIWALSYFPRNENAAEAPFADEIAQLEQQSKGASDEQKEQINERLAEIQNEIDGELLRGSFLGQAGHWIEPVVKPLGWDWKIGSAAIASFPAREVIISTMGVLYNLGGEEDEESEPLKETIKNAKWHESDENVFNIPVALSIMVFFALCAQCAATLAVIKRETNSWRWPIFTFTYMTVLAYVGALVTYQVSALFLLG